MIPESFIAVHSRSLGLAMKPLGVILMQVPTNPNALQAVRIDVLRFIAIHYRSLMVLTNPNDAISRLVITYKLRTSCRRLQALTILRTLKVRMLPALLVVILGSPTLLVPSRHKTNCFLVPEPPMDVVHPSSRGSFLLLKHESVWNMRLTSTASTNLITATATPPLSTSTTTYGPAHQSPSMVLQPARPVTAFTGLPRPTTASVQEQRRASIQRNFHPTQPLASSSSSTNSSPSRRRSGPPRQFAKPAPALASLDDFGSRAAPTMATLTIGILPKVLDTSDHNNSLDPSPRYQWKGGDDLETAQNALKRANLTFTIEVPTTGPIFEFIDVGFRDHCRRSNLVFVDSSGPVSDSPNTKPWVLLGPKGRAAGGRIWAEDPKSLTRFTFTLQALRSLPFSSTANNLGEGQFVFIAPRFCNLYGPIDCLFDPPERLPDHVLTHKCLGRCVLRPILASLARDPEPTCRPSCTPSSGILLATRPPSPNVYMSTDSDDGEYFPEADNLVDQILRVDTAPVIGLSTVTENHITPVVTRSVQRRQWEQEAIAVIVPVSTTVSSTVVPFVAGPLLTAAMEMTSTSCKPRSFLGLTGPMDLTLKNMPGSGAYSLAAWQRYLQDSTPIQDPPVHLTITARSIDEGARVLIMHCLWLFAGQTHRSQVEGIAQRAISFPASHHRWPPSEPNGPIRPAGVNAAVPATRLLGKRSKSSWLMVIIGPNARATKPSVYIPRAVQFPPQASFFLLHFIFIGAPYPASPFLFSTLFDGRKIASKFDIPFLSAFVSPHSLSLMTKIHRVPLDTPLYASQSEDCVEYQYMLNIPDFDPTIISSRRSQEEHDDIEPHSDFLLIADGFNAVVDPFDDHDRPHRTLEWFSIPCRPLILDAFDRRVKSAADILSHLRFMEINPENDPWGDNAHVVTLITEFFTHYLTESGHPADPDQDYPTTDVDGRDDYGPDISVSFRSCFQTFSITNNARLQQLLLSENLVQGWDTEFGRFIHGQLLGSQGAYTEA
ncbi:hypothetical protein C8F04DRAFT_1297867 [Mycena alexandri]|uniref:Uncharacterized protein n=1 Tax=Mycena alexandri TaxID=1745969 RepID=A0AAD6SG92_9AGAR|nr:hypothetical protein C8F04DRAFT_1297867 [Mycena alexandri]